MVCCFDQGVLDRGHTLVYIFGKKGTLLSREQYLVVFEITRKPLDCDYSFLSSHIAFSGAPVINSFI